MVEQDQQKLLENLQEKIKKIEELHQSNAEVTKDQKIFHVFEHVYLGTTWGAQDKDALLKIGINDIINCDQTHENHFPDDFKYTKLPLRDFTGEKIDKFFQQTKDLIEESGKNQRKMLVHCSGGLSRSVSIVIGWLIQSKKMTLAQAYPLLEKARQRPPLINPSFWTSLKKLENKVLGLETCSFDYTDWILEDFARLGFNPIKILEGLKTYNMDADQTFKSLLS